MLVIFLFVFLPLFAASLFLSRSASADSTPYAVTDDATGGDCPLFGTWDNATKTCTMDRDLDMAVEGNIEITGTDVTLDGNGHTITGQGSVSSGLVVGTNYWQTTAYQVTVKNVTVTNCSFGLSVRGSKDGLFENNSFVNNTGNGLSDSFEDWYFTNEHSGNVNTGNTITGNGGKGIYADTCGNPVFSDNTISGNAGAGITAHSTGWYTGVNSGWITVSGNTITNNDIGISSYMGLEAVVGNHFSGNTRGAMEMQKVDGIEIASNTFDNQYLNMNVDLGVVPGNTESCGNILVNNNFINPDLYLSGCQTSNENVFNLNYWSTHTSPDEDSDGIVDIPYVNIDIYDQNPVTAQDGWCALDPALTLRLDNIYWASLADYNNGLLSVDFIIDSMVDASEVQIVGVTNSGGVSLDTQMPLLIGGIKAGVPAEFTIVHSVPAGVSSFSTSVHGTARNACGDTIYSYPV